MEEYLITHNLPYKIIGIKNSYKFELNNIIFVYDMNTIYHHLIIYVPSSIIEKVFKKLEGIIPLIGIIESMNIYKYVGYYESFNEILNIFGFIEYGKRYKWMKSFL